MIVSGSFKRNVAYGQAKGVTVVDFGVDFIVDAFHIRAQEPGTSCTNFSGIEGTGWADASSEFSSMPLSSGMQPF